jgi:hypothetical protein
MQIKWSLCSDDQAVQRRRDMLVVLHCSPRLIVLSRTFVQVLMLSTCHFSRNVHP